MTDERFDYQQPLNDEERRLLEEMEQENQRWLAEMKRLKNFNDALWKWAQEE